ncbi:MAG: ATP-binding protein, partial [Chitinophagaceae bacterium]
VQIDVRYRKFSFKITDNGKGFSGATKGNGSGWKNMQNRCEEINGKVTIESKDAKGTIISISLPYPFKIPSFWDNNRSIL